MQRGGTGMIQFILASLVFAHFTGEQFVDKPVMAELSLLQSQNIKVAHANEELNVGIAFINSDQAAMISEASHKLGRCGGYQDLELGVVDKSKDYSLELKKLEKAVAKEKSNQFLVKNINLTFDQSIANAMAEVNSENLQDTVEMLSAFPNRYNKDSRPNKHLSAMEQKINDILADYAFPSEVRLISHNSTAQKTIAVKLIGKDKPNEHVVLGGHLDSIRSVFGFPMGGAAPGADDNASGSANILEALRVIASLGQPSRTIEFFWYAGEESGLLGSAEIAKDYKRRGVDVVSVLQIDMSLMPGDGELVIGSVTDFTASWLRDLMKQINDLYLNVRIVEFACGYGCSDHASWTKEGYSAFAPFESTMDSMNQNLHTPNDVIDGRSSFEHSAVFSKIAVAYALHIANSDFRGL